MTSIDQPSVSTGVDDFVSTIANDRAKLGYGLQNNEGEAFWLYGMLQTIKIGRDDTDGRYGLIETVVPVGLGSPWHVHHEEDEWFYVLDGELTIYVGDARLSLPAGGFGFGPKGVPHTFFAEQPEGARILVGLQPMQYEGFLREVGVPAPERVLPPRPEGHPDMARLARIVARNGFEILGPPGPPPGR
jgi:mannose-6-phosphate isomerase-like protein (cupin superfamily)